MSEDSGRGTSREQPNIDANLTDKERDIVRLLTAVEKWASTASVSRSVEGDDVSEERERLEELGFVDYWYSRDQWRLTDEGQEWHDENDPAVYHKVWGCGNCGNEFELRDCSDFHGDDWPAMCPWCGTNEYGEGSISAQDVVWRV